MHNGNGHRCTRIPAFVLFFSNRKSTDFFLRQRLSHSTRKKNIYFFLYSIYIRCIFIFLSLSTTSPLRRISDTIRISTTRRHRFITCENNRFPGIFRIRIYIFIAMTVYNMYLYIIQYTCERVCEDGVSANTTTGVYLLERIKHLFWKKNSFVTYFHSIGRFFPSCVVWYRTHCYSIIWSVWFNPICDAYV